MLTPKIPVLENGETHSVVFSFFKKTLLFSLNDPNVKPELTAANPNYILVLYFFSSFFRKTH